MGLHLSADQRAGLMVIGLEFMEENRVDLLDPYGAVGSQLVLPLDICHDEAT
jgi:hypothetical protein